MTKYEPQIQLETVEIEKSSITRVATRFQYVQGKDENWGKIKKFSFQGRIVDKIGKFCW